jgi:hypothetical protein
MAPEARSCIHGNESLCFIPSYLLGSQEQLHSMELVSYNSLIKIVHA